MEHCTLQYSAVALSLHGTPPPTTNAVYPGGTWHVPATHCGMHTGGPPTRIIALQDSPAEQSLSPEHCLRKVESDKPVRSHVWLLHVWSGPEKVDGALV